MLRRNFNSFRQRLSGFVRPDSEGERVNPQMFFEVTGKCGGVHLREILLGVYSHFLLSTIFFSFSERSASLTNTTSPLRRVTSRAASEIRARSASEGTAPLFSTAWMVIGSSVNMDRSPVANRTRV